MKQVVIAIACVLCIAYTTNAFAQNTNKDRSIESDQIIIDNKDHEGLTTIEIKNGKLFIDGKKISDLEANTKIKIIKKNTIGEQHDLNFGLDNLDMPFSFKSQKSFRLPNNKVLLGVKLQNAKTGAEVLEVLEESTAEKIGILKGDIIIGIDDKEIRNSEDLVNTMSEFKNGDEIEIELVRGAKIKKLYATLEANKMEPIPFAKIPGTGKFSLPFQHLEDIIAENGMHTIIPASKTPQIGIEIEEDENGLIISSIKPNSAAAKAGLRKGDEIKTIEGNEVQSIAAIKKEIADYKNNKKLRFGVKRAGAIKTLPVVLPRAKKRAQF